MIYYEHNTYANNPNHLTIQIIGPLQDWLVMSGRRRTKEKTSRTEELKNDLAPFVEVLLNYKWEILEKCSTIPE